MGIRFPRSPPASSQSRWSASWFSILLISTLRKAPGDSEWKAATDVRGNQEVLEVRRGTQLECKFSMKSIYLLLLPAPGVCTFFSQLSFALFLLARMGLVYWCLTLLAVHESFGAHVRSSLYQFRIFEKCK